MHLSNNKKRYKIDEMAAGCFGNCMKDDLWRRNRHIIHELEHILWDLYDEPISIDDDMVVRLGHEEFGINEMSDGYASIMSIVIDLMLKMNYKNMEYWDLDFLEKPGIVLIDDVEAYIHIDLQKKIMPLLTRLFPNIQFIVTTHSPYVLSSLENAVAYDLGYKKMVYYLTNYSYSALAEGYFGVSEESSYIKIQLDKLKALLEKKELDEGEIASLKYLVADFEKISASALPNIKGEYLRLKGDYMKKLKQWEVL